MKIYLTIGNNRKFINTCNCIGEATRIIDSYIRENNKLADKYREKPKIRNTVPSYLNDTQIMEWVESRKVEECDYIIPVFVEWDRVDEFTCVCDIAETFIWQQKGLVYDQLRKDEDNYEEVPLVNKKAEFKIVMTSMVDYVANGGAIR